MAATEFELISRYFARPGRHAALGIGDDAALLGVAPGLELAVTTDMLVENVHFFADADPVVLGYKALAVNLSDLAAMGAAPRYVLLALALPVADERWIREFAAGFFELADRHDVELVGGDTTRGPLTICVQAMGEVPRGAALRRDGAHPGDDIWVSGTLGDAAAAVAHRKGELQLPHAVLAQCLSRLDRPVPRIELGRALVGLATAAVDLSDGLLADLGHICERSRAGAIVRFPSLPCSGGLIPLRHEGPVQRAMAAGGDDYELCFTVPARRRSEVEALSAQLSVELARIGQIVEHEGVMLLDDQEHKMDLGRMGFDHFG